MSEILSFCTILILAFILETLDSSLGQGYGTLGSPILILLGFEPQIIVPAILLSQACGGFSAAFFHHHFHNANFKDLKGDDFKKVYLIVSCGLIGVCVASFIGFSIPKYVLSLYIGILVLAIGLLILANITIFFSWPKFILLGLISAFNKGISGGGYGPLVAGGQILIGVPSKSAVAITDMAEVPICLAGFVIWSFKEQTLPMSLVIPLCLGATLAPMLGAWLTYRLTLPNFRRILGSVLVLLGILCIAKLLNP